ncbi:RNA cytidine acetyltransferase 1-like [Lycium barbarum]|uniref:RNA cytidine acetyltransferase 1-like n=1 Tax=Lycium barbarum TaxID=112863 RepID=UPI00293F720C|nr:RNA cytidine acetyltransferase 1-like [Lycium barbarum]
MRKKVDERIRTLIENGVKNRHRSMFVIIGDKSRDQIVNLHYMLSKAVVKSRPNVLWCYKDKLELSSHKKKRKKQMKKMMQQGVLDPEKADPFDLFVETGGVSYCLYRDSERILGNTFGMCILQDFEALTPNLLARTIETVEGGGLIVLLLRNLSSLTSLFTMAMDVHSRFRTESHSRATGRFNERFILSLASCETCIVMDDELNILPISSHMKKITAVPVKEDSEGLSEAERELRNLKEQLNEDFPVGPLIRKCCTLDQGKAVITFLDSILDKSLRSTVALLAARGRGKSAALGLAIAGAVAAGYSNIFVTAPSPENLKTLFDFVCKGFQMLEYKEHLDYDIVKSNNPEFKKATVRINIYKQHRQTIQYILPHEHEKLSQVELLVVDEAAAIPLPVVKFLLGPYLVFLASTVNGYEGTGRSLSLKLLQQLEEQSQQSKSADSALSGRLFKKIELSESIRYASGDRIERWLNALLCLDVTNSIPSIRRLPEPGDCDIYYVNRDTLFSYHKDSELFLQRMMALYVASHYKNSPNDLQLMADAPAHHLFVLLAPVDESENRLPDILCVIQVCLEGQISQESAKNALSQGRQPFGDQIPWKFSQQFADHVFPSLSGARIIRIATHPSAMRLGYGSAAVELLTRYFEGQLTQLSEAEIEDTLETPQVNVTEAAEKVSLQEENIKPRSDLPPLLVPLRERRSERLHYLGVSFGLTLDLFRFWRNHKFAPFFIGNAPNSVTGEYTCMVLKALKNDDVEDAGSDEWGFYGSYYRDYKRRLVELLGSTYRKMNYKLAMSVFDPKINFAEQDPASSASSELSIYMKFVLEPHEMKRLEAYSNSLIDYPLIRDVAQKLAREYFLEHIPVSLSYVQASLLLCYGVQHKDIPEIEGEMNLERQQILSLFMKVMKRLSKYLHNLRSKEFESSTVSRLKAIKLDPHPISLDEDLNDAAREAQDEMKAKTTEDLLDPELFQQYAIVDREADFENALQNGGGKIGGSSGVVSLKSNKSKLEKHSTPEKTEKSDKKRYKSNSGSKSHKKRKS